MVRAIMFHRTRSLVGKLALIQTSFLVVALASIAFTLWVSWQLEGGAGAINEAGRMRMLSYRMTLAHGAGDQASLSRDLRDFGVMLERLRQGDPQRPLFLPDTEDCASRLIEVEQAWPALRGSLLSATPAPQLRDQTDAFVARIDALVGAVEHTIAARTAILGGLCFGLVVLVVAASVVFVSGTYVWIIQPLQRLRDGLQRMAAGQLGARVDEAASVDEFSRLASGFNQMAQALQQAYEGLEGKVKDKTAHLARQNERLQALYDVAQMGSREGEASLESLAQSFAVQLARIARADASAVRLAAQDGERWLLLGQSCLPQAMIDAERCLRHGECACGVAGAPADGPRVIPIHSVGQPKLGHCEAAGYQTVIAIPMRAGTRQIGEVELFHYGEHRLGDEERQLLDALVGQFATQVDNARLAARDREMAVSEERNLLAQELHDSIAQVLAFLKIQVQLLRGAMARQRGEEVDRVIDEIDTGVRECYANVRELLVHFRTRPGHEDIEHALRTTLAKFERQSGLSTHLSLGGDGLPLPPDQQVQVLHIIQEALSNVRKHAEADHVSLRVEQLPRWSFELQDNGRGFAMPDAEAASTHVGLQIMRERAARIGARLSIETPPEGGTRVRLVLPEQMRAFIPENSPASRTEGAPV
ncbi:type IV pili methyl-accepting chemotaxis transducer N-terminal domain-containing protein [Pelomonas sp. V22]|uniref:type IV pili methyl-accepting chemotaxis transducer N-terminal domain-containing protein n=1 Tax=Pelomonas sp. V22 TaxID=2822139 RepID=UPI0024A8574B|nr:type IV pili methyl-accepting chemotaxis transducer N-terminal domain-containing protein [Pelomonas sp. V22]MDI4634067.1 type IV pili methyl-accepting chemotaxis transducer N-terminal domain-containing protein [Pelomonas sp. V22]